jgi:3-hydroxyacyl-CoA dehydrogenase/enoyl-CoA hydratase/3-hydroxybutyryl-CoA epimerase
MENLFGISLSVREGIAYLTLDYPQERVNKLSTPLMQALDRAAVWLAESAASIKACILTSAKEGSFIVGADIDEIKNVTDERAGAEAAAAGQAVLEKLNRLPFPVVCVINGTCMGGGTELALACHYRLATDHPKTRIALPEVMLGIIPGFGGTQRLPRLIGLQRALPLILSGKALDPVRAYKNAVVDKVVPWTYAVRHAEDFVQEILSGKSKKYIERRKIKGLMPVLLETMGRGLIYRQARKSVLKETKGHYPAPLKALQSVREGLGRSMEEGLRIEATYLGEMIVTPISKNLIRIFRLTERVKKQNGAANPSVKPQPVHYAGILGAGVMGGGIAQLFAANEVDVRLKDINHQAVGTGLSAAASVFGRQVKRRRLTRREMQRKMGLITGTLDYTGFGRCDLVVEAIVENMDIKKNVIREIAPHVKDDCVLTSNTSSLSITEMASASKRPEFFVGMHFFNPVHRMPLVEVIRGKQTSDTAVVTVYEFAKKLGKTPIVVQDGAGFLVNRLLLPYLNEAGFLLEEGVRVEELDRAMLDFGMPMGPCLLLDEIGIDVAYKVGKIFEAAFGDRVQGSTVVQKLYEDHRLGKKGKLGFYVHGKDRATVDPKVYALIQPKGKKVIAREETVRRLTYPMINEAARCLAEGIVCNVDDIEIGMIFGTGFPPFRGGLMRYADTEGLDTVVRHLESFASKFGSRFEPCDHLRNLQKSGKTFHHDN